MAISADTQEMNEQFMATFRQTAAEMIKNIHEKAILLESRLDDQEVIEELFRTFHTLKGNAAFLGLNDIKAVAHALEDLLKAVQVKEVPVDKIFFESLWEGIGLLGKGIDSIGAPILEDASHDTAGLFIAALKQRMSQCKFVRNVSPVAVRSSDAVHYFYDETDVSRLVYSIQSYLGSARDTALESEGTEKLLLAINLLYDVFAKKNDSRNTDICKNMLSELEIMVDDSGRLSAPLLVSMGKYFADICSSLRKIEFVAQPVKNEKAPAKMAPSFRIEEKKIDELFRAVNKLEKVGNSFGMARERLFQTDSPPELQQQVYTAINELNTLARELFQMLIRVKLVSPEAFLEKSKRIIMALADSCNKKIEVKVDSKSVFVERSNVEILDGILIHVMRNAVDHGIELPVERVSLGKTETGLIRIELFEDHDSLVVKVFDDGRGIDAKALKEAACKSGKISNEQKDSLSDEEAIKLLFLPGISTKESISEVSGRGVGMDVVNNTIAKAGGSVNIQSKPAQGTLVEIKLPVKLAA